VNPQNPSSDSEPWTIVLLPLPDSVPVANRIRRLLKTAKSFRLRCVIVRDTTAGELTQTRDWEV
jgi:hypothetical protein